MKKEKFNFRGIFTKPIIGLLKGFAKEIHSKAGNANLFVDVLLAIITVVSIIASAMDNIVYYILLAIRPELAIYAPQSQVSTMCILLVSFSAFCVILMYQADKNESRIKKSGK